MNTLNVISILAIILSPVIAVLVSIWVQARREKRGQKMYIFDTLIRTRHSGVTNEMVRAFNMIDVVFYNKPIVRKLWREYFDMLGNKALTTEPGLKQRRDKYLELLYEMAKVLGYGKAISHLDIDRVYYPVGLGETTQRTEEILNELLRFLKSSGGVDITVKEREKPKEEITGGDDKQ